jgi:16S rRNA (guanine1207-N2)-methyltransferase
VYEAADALMFVLARVADAAGPVPVIGAVPFEPLLRHLGERIVAVQPWRAAARGLGAVGVAVRPEADVTGAALAVCLPEGQRDAARAQVGAAAATLGEGGVLLVSVPNLSGAAWMEKRVREVCADVRTESRRHCRVLRVGDPAALAAWAGLDAPRPVLDGRFISRPGLFSWDEVDPGSALLAKHAVGRVGGRVADAGAGWGWLSRQLLDGGGIGALDLLEADARALALAVRNTAGASVPVTPRWCDVTDEHPVTGLDAVVTNPPFHEAGRTDPKFGISFLAGAAKLLRPGGELWLVANARLPYEVPLRAMASQVRAVATEGGYKVLAVSGLKRA